MDVHHFRALTADCLLETFVMEVGVWEMIDALRATVCQKIMPMGLDLGINAHHYVVIAKHFGIPADFVLQSQDAHHLPGATTGQEFH